MLTLLSSPLLLLSFQNIQAFPKQPINLGAVKEQYIVGECRASTLFNYLILTVFSLGLYQRAQCPLGLLMYPLGLAQNQNAPFGVLTAT